MRWRGRQRTTVGGVLQPTWFPSTVGDPSDFRLEPDRSHEVRPNAPEAVPWRGPGPPGPPGPAVAVDAREDADEPAYEPAYEPPPPPQAEPVPAVPTPVLRGLVLRSLTLKQVDRGWFKSLFGHNPDELYVVSIGLDLSGERPFVWPHDPANAGQAAIKVRPGERHEFSFGLGYPIYLPRPIVGGLALSILVAASKAKERDWWSHISAATQLLDNDDGVGTFLKAAALNPVGIAMSTGLQAVATAVGIVSRALADAGDDNLGSFQGIFPANGSWDRMLADDRPDLAIELSEIAG